MKQNKKAIILFLLLIFSIFIDLSVTAETNPDLSKEKLYSGSPKKDPILASSISWYIPGGGQFYSGNFKKGMFFLTTETALFITTLGLVTNYSYDIGNGFLVDAKTDVTLKDKQLAWGLGGLLLGLHIYNIVDAYKTAKNYNDKIDKEIMDQNLRYVYQDRKDPFIAGILSWKMPGLGQVYTKKYYKGSKFMLGSIILKAWGFYLYQDLEEKYGEKSFGITWKELSKNDKNLVLTYGVFYLTFEIVNIFDAIHASKEYNAKQKRLLSNRIVGNVVLDEKSKQLKLVYTWKF